MTEDESGGRVVSLAERRAQLEAREADARREQARDQTRVDPSELPKPWLTYVLIGANLLVWLTMVATGVNAMDPSGEALLTWGGNYGVLTSNGEWWRLLTATFLHGGIIHLAFNLYFFWIVGRICEQIFGPAAYATVYFGSGLLASFVSLAWQPTGLSVGASGALFGVFGAFLAFTLRRKSMLPEGFVSAVRRNALVLVGLNLAIGLMVPNIDLAAHLGGLAAGFGLGYLIALLAERPVSSPREARAVRVRAVAAAAGVTALVLALGSLAIPRWDDARATIEAHAIRHDEIRAAFEASHADTAKQIEILEHEAIPATDEALAELKALDTLPDDETRAEVELWTHFFELTRQALDAELEGLRSSDPLATARAARLHTEAMDSLSK